MVGNPAGDMTNELFVELHDPAAATIDAVARGLPGAPDGIATGVADERSR